MSRPPRHLKNLESDPILIFSYVNRGRYSLVLLVCMTGYIFVKFYFRTGGGLVSVRDVVRQILDNTTEPGRDIEGRSN